MFERKKNKLRRRFSHSDVFSFRVRLENLSSFTAVLWEQQVLSIQLKPAPQQSGCDLICKKWLETVISLKKNVFLPLAFDGSSLCFIILFFSFIFFFKIIEFSFVHFSIYSFKITMRSGLCLHNVNPPNGYCN